MNILFIPSLFEHDYVMFFVKTGIMVSLWIFVMIACFIDLRTGIKATKASGSFKTHSFGLRRTGRKIREYWTLMLLALFIDFALSSLALMKHIFPWLAIFQLPFVSMGLFIGVMITEIISVKENIEKAKGAQIIPPQTVELMSNIMSALGDNGEQKLSALAQLLKESVNKKSEEK